MRVLLDTHVLVYWCSEPDTLAPAQRHALAQSNAENPALVADISLWEIAMLAMHGVIDLQLPIREWLNRAVAAPLVRVAPITPAIAGKLEMLSDWPNRDPADRLIIATARVFGASVVTNDEGIRESGLVSVI